MLTRFEQHLLLELESFEYESGEVLERAKGLYEGIVRELRNKYLGRTTPELNQLVSHFNEILNVFLTVEFPPHIPAITKLIVREARLAMGSSASATRSPPTASRAFASRTRSSFSPARPVRRRRDAEARTRARREVPRRDDPLRGRPADLQRGVRADLDATYDFLYNEGFLDLPADWRANWLTRDS